MAKRKGKRRMSNYGDAVKYAPNAFIERENKPVNSSGETASTEKSRGADLIREQENERLRREMLTKEEAPNRITAVFNQQNIKEGIRLYRMKMRRTDMALEAKGKLEAGLGRKLSVRTIEDDIGNVSSTTKDDVIKDVVSDYSPELQERMRDPIFDQDGDGRVEEFEEEDIPGMKSLMKYM